MSEKSKLKITKSLSYIFLCIVAFVCLMPFYSMIISSTHSNAAIASEFLLAPGKELLDNYSRLIDTVPIWRGLFNSVFITVTATVLNLYFSTLVGYAFSKYKFKGNNFLFMFILGTMMIPGQLGIIGLYKIMDMMHLLNTYWPLILPAIANAFGVFLMKQMADTNVPNEILESGRIDGCSELKIFHRLVLPILSPAIATLGIISFIGKWNEFLQPMIILFDNNLQPLPVMIASVKSQFATDFGAMYVGIAISVVPILIIFSLLSKRIISGVTDGAVKG